jgi:uncharacterized surface protein with fasciclin (FAS1) repeats
MKQPSQGPELPRAERSRGYAPQSSERTPAVGRRSTAPVGGGPAVAHSGGSATVFGGAAGLDPAVRAELQRAVAALEALTYLVPNPAATAALVPELVESWATPAGAAQFQGVLGQHLLAQTLSLAALTGAAGQFLATEGDPLWVEALGGQLWAGDGRVVSGDEVVALVLPTGVIQQVPVHTVDRVLFPDLGLRDTLLQQTASAADPARRFGTLLALFDSSPAAVALLAAPGQTLLAPDDGAFAAAGFDLAAALAPAAQGATLNLLRRHLLAGGHPAGALLAAGALAPLAGAPLPFALGATGLTVAGVATRRVNRRTLGGWLHVLAGPLPG